MPSGVEIYEVNGPFFFGAANKLKSVLEHVSSRPRVFILRMRNVPTIDATGMRVLDELHESCARRGVALLLSGVREQPREALARSGRTERYGAASFVPDLDAGLARARELSAPTSRRG